MDKWLEQENMVCVTMYADTTRQYTEDEIEELMNSTWGQMIDIPVPYELLREWFCEDGKYTEEEFRKWFYEESTADDVDGLYDWLVAHNYNWKRLN